MNNKILLNTLLCVSAIGLGLNTNVEHVVAFNPLENTTQVIDSFLDPLYSPLPSDYVSAINTKYCPNLTRTLYVGSKDQTTGGEVSKLQQFLASDTTLYPEGEITGYFGAATEKAVQRFQARWSIVLSGNRDTTGYGVVGMKTRAQITTVCNQKTTITPVTNTGNARYSLQDVKSITKKKVSKNTLYTITLKTGGVRSVTVPDKSTTDQKTALFTITGYTGTTSKLIAKAQTLKSPKTEPRKKSKTTSKTRPTPLEPDPTPLEPIPLEPNPNVTTTDVQRIADLKNIQAALEKYYAKYGTYTVSGGGYRGFGQGYVNKSNSDKYTKSVINVLYDEGYLSSQSIDDFEQAPGYMLYTCDAGQRYSLSASLKQPSVIDGAHIKRTCNGSGPNSTHDTYMKNFALTQTSVIVPEEFREKPAVGDGIADDSDALQKAIAMAATVPNGKVLLKNTYKIRKNLQIVGVKNIRITGGGTVHASGTDIPAVIFHVMRGSENITIDNLNLKADYNYNSFPNPSYFPFSTVGLIMVGRSDGDNGTINKRVTIDNVKMEGCPYAGVMVVSNNGITGSSGTEDVVFKNSTVTNCAFGIFASKNTHRLKILNNTILNSRIDGIALDTKALTDTQPSTPSPDAEVRGNTILNTGRANYHSAAGILAKGQWDRIVIDSNIVRNVKSVYSSVFNLTQAAGIMVVKDADGKVAADSVTITNNTVSDIAPDITAGAGNIYVSGGITGAAQKYSNVLIADNKLSNGKGNGIQMAYAENVTVRGNSCEKCHFDKTVNGFAFYLGKGVHGGTVESNSISNSTPQVYGGIDTLNAENITVLNNQIPVNVTLPYR